MWQNCKVLIIDDNESRQYDLKVLLEFLNETTLVANSKNWQDLVHHKDGDEDYIVVFIGDFSQSKQSIEQLLKSIREWNDELAVVLISENPPSENGLDDLLRHMIIASLTVPPAYNKLIDTLHRARLYREAQSSGKRQPQRRPVHLFRSLVGTSREIQNGTGDDGAGGRKRCFSINYWGVGHR